MVCTSQRKTTSRRQLQLLWTTVTFLVIFQILTVFQGERVKQQGRDPEKNLSEVIKMNNYVNTHLFRVMFFNLQHVFQKKPQTSNQEFLQSITENTHFGSTFSSRGSNWTSLEHWRHFSCAFKNKSIFLRLTSCTTALQILERGVIWRH